MNTEIGSAIMVEKHCTETSLSLGHKFLTTTISSYFPFVADVMSAHANSVLPNLTVRQRSFALGKSTGSIRKLEDYHSIIGLQPFLRADRIAHSIDYINVGYSDLKLPPIAGLNREIDFEKIWRVLANCDHPNLAYAASVSETESGQILSSAKKLQALIGQHVFTGLTGNDAPAKNCGTREGAVRQVPPRIQQAFAALEKSLQTGALDDRMTQRILSVWTSSVDVVQQGFFLTDDLDAQPIIAAFSLLGIPPANLKLQYVRHPLDDQLLERLTALGIEVERSASLKNRGRARFRQADDTMFKISVCSASGGLAYGKTVNEIFLVMYVAFDQAKSSELTPEVQ